MLEKCETLSLEGLRTLVIAQKILTQDEYNKWSEEYRRAKNDYERGDFLAEQVQAKLETDMECLGVTGVEDKLQDNVAMTIEGL